MYVATCRKILNYSILQAVWKNITSSGRNHRQNMDSHYSHIPIHVIGQKIFTLSHLRDYVKGQDLSSSLQSISPISPHIHIPPHLYKSPSRQFNKIFYGFFSYLTRCRGGNCQKPTECPPAPSTKVFCTD